MATEGLYMSVHKPKNPATESVVTDAMLQAAARAFYDWEYENYELIPDGSDGEVKAVLRASLEAAIRLLLKTPIETNGPS